ncbi:MAG: lipopolysaccharide transport periplasmic protein LptA [Persephonella sp.]|nr:MAG: lipopolysaccharide transport periplasmic protein LptA [Persephonella sp.]RUM61647.1 MAG: lipopolysaccharide transport periplasmic protein LptA [Persephonella sp.]
MKKVFITLLFSLILINLSFGESKKVEPTIIEADELIYNQKKNEAIYRGNVIAKKGDMSLYADKMDIFLTKNGDIAKIIATGNVRFYKKPDREGKGDIAIYEKKSNTITLKGKNAILKQGDNMVEGEIIVYHLDTEITEVKSNRKNKRVKSILFPKEKGGR